jgi:hypothetical protein
MKLKERRFQTDSQAVLNSVKENDFHGAFGGWKNNWIAVYIPKETILKEMAAKMPAFLFFT